VVDYKTVCYKMVQCYKTVRGLKRYITKQYGYKTVHETKRCTVKKQYVAEQYNIIKVQYHNGLVER
jgi:hypothetical protein